MYSIPLVEPVLLESSLIADAEPSTNRVTHTGKARDPLWYDTFREATAIDVNIAGFHTSFELGFLLDLLLGLSFLQSILPRRQPTPVDTYPPEFFPEPEPEPKESSSHAIGNATTKHLEEDMAGFMNAIGSRL